MPKLMRMPCGYLHSSFSCPLQCILEGSPIRTRRIVIAYFAGQLSLTPSSGSLFAGPNFGRVDRSFAILLVANLSSFQLPSQGFARAEEKRRRAPVQKRL